MKMKASISSAVEPLLNVRRYADPVALTPSECILMDALVQYGGVTKAARALGLGVKSTASRMTTIRQKLDAASSADAVRIWRERKDAA